MKLFPALLALTLVPAVLLPFQDQEPKKKKGNPITDYPRAEGERMAKEIQGSWLLTNYDDPTSVALTNGAVNGFATFHEGFLTLIFELQSLETGPFGVGEHIIAQAGVFRYRFDERAGLQTSSVMGYSNLNATGELTADVTGQGNEYLIDLKNDLLELRSVSQVRLSFRRVHAGEFPQATIKDIERRRHGPETEDGGF